MPIAYKIEKGIAIPPQQNKGEVEAFLKTVKVDEAFVVPVAGKVQHLRNVGKKLKYTMTSRSLGKDKGFRVWRIK